MSALLNFIKKSNLAKYLVIELILGAFLSITTGEFSIFLGVAITLSCLPFITNLKFFDDKLKYDHKAQVVLNSLLFSSIAWAIYIWQNLQSLTQLNTFTSAVLIVSALVLFNSVKKRLAIIVPILVSLLLVLFFIHSPSAIALSILIVLITALLFVFKTTIDSEIEIIKDETSGSVPANKMDLISQLDVARTENEKLVEGTKNLESRLSAAEMAKMEFLATMSHEIRTPLNGIIPLLDILLDSELTDFQKDYLSTAHVSAIQMQKLIDDLLDYSKVEAGELTVEIRGLKILRIMEAVQISYTKAAQKKNLGIKVDVSHNVSPLLRGDPTRLRQVLSNLISNAIKFSSKGVIKIAVTKIKDYPNKEVIRFEVVDEGIGLDKETADTIFQPFTQEDNTSTRKFGGTGLGLAISKKIVELMHGTIGVKSQKGKGSTFYFDLPLLKSVGETGVGLKEAVGYQAVLVNTNPLLFNKLSQKLKDEDVPFQKALGLSQAYDIYATISKVSKQSKKVLVFIDFETAGKQVRNLCQDLVNDPTMDNLIACIITDNVSIAGVPQKENIKLISKQESIPELLNSIDVLGASLEANSNEAYNNIGVNEVTEEDGVGEKGSEEIGVEVDISTISPEVLLVEDNEVNLKVAEKLIQYIGYPFDFAMNGQEAFEKVKKNRYRMILMDCQMPVMDGYKCTSKIRDYEAAAGLNHTPILAMTANAMIGDREKCLDSGMDDYMSKPLNRYILEKTLKKWDPLVKSFTPQHSTDLAREENIVGNRESAEVLASEVEKPVETTKPTAKINQKWLSTKALKELREIMGDEVVPLLEIFEQETPSIIIKMNDAINSNNYEDVQKMAHMMKSTSANIGANGLSFFSRKMELAANNNDRVQLQEIYIKIKKAYTLTGKEIGKYKNSQ